MRGELADCGEGRFGRRGKARWFFFAGANSHSKYYRKMNCSVCRLNFRRTDQGAARVECATCGLACHRCCYSYSSGSKFQCDPCADNAKRAVCVICGGKGLLRRLSDQQGIYCHISCAVFSPQIEVMSYHSMTLATKSSLDKKLKDKCKNCGKIGASITCLDCKVHCHPHCIYQEQLERENEDNEVDQWIFNLKISPKNNQQSLLSVSSSQIKQELKAILEAVLAAFDKGKKAKQLNPLKDQTRQQMESFIENFKYQPSEPVQWTSNDKVVAYCQSHMESHRLFCICRSTNNNKQMVQCDSCYEWYHFSCIKRKNVKDESYICDSCKAWQRQRNNMDLENPKLLDLDQLIPKDITILHLIDFLPILIYMEVLMQHLPKIALTQPDYHNLKFYKLYLASLPIKPSHVLELDNILIKEVILEEFRSQVQCILPAFKSQDQNQAYSEELVHQLRLRGYHLELNDDRLIKTLQVKRKELRALIQTGIAEGYLFDDTFQRIENSLRLATPIDPRQVLKSPNESLAKAVEKYRLAQYIKEKARKLFDYQPLSSINHTISDRLELLEYKLNLIQDHQKKKPKKQSLIELKNLAKSNNISLGCLQVLEQLEEEITNLESNYDSMHQIVHFPASSDLLQEILRKQCLNELISVVAQQVEAQIKLGNTVNISDNQGVYTLNNMKLAAQESPLIRSQLILVERAVDLYSKNQPLNLNIYQELKRTLEQCQLRTQLIAEVEKQTVLFGEVYTKINSPITLEEFERLAEQATTHLFDLDLQLRKQQLLKALEWTQKQELNDELFKIIPRIRQLKSKDFNDFADNVEEQLQFIDQYHDLLHHQRDPIQKMIERLSVAEEVDFPLEVFQMIPVPAKYFDQIKPVVDGFLMNRWRAEVSLILNQERVNIPEVNRLLSQAPVYKCQSLYNQLSALKIQYDDWLNKFQEFERNFSLDLTPGSPEFTSQFNRLIKIITQNRYRSNDCHQKLLVFYSQMVWSQKVHEFYTCKATIQSLSLLLNCGEKIRIPPNCKVLIELRSKITILNDLQSKIKQYYEQRYVWIKQREQQVSNLTSYKSYFKFLEAKPEVRQIQEIYELAKDYPQFKTKDIKDDLEDIKQVLIQYNDLASKNHEVNYQLQQLQKIRNFYCLCFLKVSNFSLQLMYCLIKYTSLKCLKQLSGVKELQDRLHEINQLILLGGDDWIARINQTNKCSTTQLARASDFEFIDQSLTDDFEWVKWIEENSAEFDCSDVKLAKRSKKKVFECNQLQEKNSIKTQINDGVNEETRMQSRLELSNLLIKYQRMKQPEHVVRTLEAAIFMEHNLSLTHYQKEMERVRQTLKAQRLSDFSLTEIKKQYKLIVQSHKKLSNSSKSQMHLDSVRVVKQQEKKAPTQLIKIQSDPDPEKKPRLLLSVHHLTQSQSSHHVEPLHNQFQTPQLQAAPTVKETPGVDLSKGARQTSLLFNPDGNSEPTNQVKQKTLMSLGEINLQIGRKTAEGRTKYIVRPQLLTYDYRHYSYFPQSVTEFELTSHCYTPAEKAVDYFCSQKEHSGFKLILGWLYSRDLQVASDLFKLAEHLKSSKQCIGYKRDSIGITVMFHKQMEKLRPTTKWIVMKEEQENKEYMNLLNNYSNLEKLQPHLCYVLYCKDAMIIPNSLQPLKVNYTNIYKIHQLTQVIENNKLQQKNKANEQKKQNLEPISDEDNKNAQLQIPIVSGHSQPNVELQKMMLEIPNILNLLDSKR